MQNAKFPILHYEFCILHFYQVSIESHSIKFYTQLPMRNSLILIGLFLVGLLLVGCGVDGDVSLPLREIERQNPLAAEYASDQMIEYVTELQIRADERGDTIDDPNILRAIDEVFIEARAVQKEAHKGQNEGKIGGFYGINNNFALGMVLLSGEHLYTGYETEIDAAPGVEIYLSQHVSPHEPEELFSEPIIELGPLQSIRGAQVYYVGPLSDDDWNEYRTVALYSRPLDQVIALVQIRGVVR